MTPQMRLVAAGIVGGAIAKFWFKRDNQTAILFGFATISLVSILTIEKENTVIA